MNATSFNSLRGKVARTCNAIVYDHLIRRRDTLPTQKQLKQIAKYAKRGMLDAIYEAYHDLKEFEE